MFNNWVTVLVYVLVLCYLREWNLINQMFMLFTSMWSSRQNENQVLDNSVRRWKKNPIKPHVNFSSIFCIMYSHHQNHHDMIWLEVYLWQGLLFHCFWEAGSLAQPAVQTEKILNFFKSYKLAAVLAESKWLDWWETNN